MNALQIIIYSSSSMGGTSPLHSIDLLRVKGTTGGVVWFLTYMIFVGLCDRKEEVIITGVCLKEDLGVTNFVW